MLQVLLEILAEVLILLSILIMRMDDIMTIRTHGLFIIHTLLLLLVVEILVHQVFHLDGVDPLLICLVHFVLPHLMLMVVEQQILIHQINLEGVMMVLVWFRCEEQPCKVMEHGVQEIPRDFQAQVVDLLNIGDQPLLASMVL